MPRVALVHALAQSIAPVNEEMARLWPECLRMNLLDDSLSADVARSAAGLDDAMTVRFVRLAEYAVSTGVHGILFSCSAFGPCIDEVARRFDPIPVLKPNEAMIDDAARRGGHVGLVATFAPTLRSMPREFPATVRLSTALAEGALDALQADDASRHDRLVAEAARRLAGHCDVIALAQFSMARAADVVAQTVGLPVLSPVSSAVHALRRRLAGG